MCCSLYCCKSFKKFSQDAKIVLIFLFQKSNDLASLNSKIEISAKMSCFLKLISAICTVVKLTGQLDIYLAFPFSGVYFEIHRGCGGPSQGL